QLALAELRAGRMESALNILQTAVERLDKESELADLHGRLQTRRDRVRLLVDFYRLSTEGELAVAEKSRTHQGDQEAREKFRAALNHLAVFDHERWWEHLPDDDLTALQREQLRVDAYRGLHYLAALICKGGIPEFFGGKAGPAAFKEALQTAA